MEHQLRHAQRRERRLAAQHGARFLGGAHRVRVERLELRRGVQQRLQLLWYQML
jgi:hypothetical protein